MSKPASSPPTDCRSHRRAGLHVHIGISLALPFLLVSTTDAFSPLPPYCLPATTSVAPPSASNVYSSQGPPRRFAALIRGPGNGVNAPRMTDIPVGDPSEKHIPNNGASISASATPTVGSSSIASNKDDDDDELLLSTMPWSDFQWWALRDNLPKYVVSIPNSGQYALWRTMLRDVTELAGYDVEFLRRRHQRLLRLDAEKLNARGCEEGGRITIVSEASTNTSKQILEGTPGALPLLDLFEFTSDGGVAGLAYGIPGIADGSAVRTTTVADVTETVPLGYVRTEDGTVAYELGLPAGEFHSLGGTMTGSTRRGMLEEVARTASSVVRAGGDIGDRALEGASRARVGNGNLVDLAGTTVVALAGAVAVGMLSHHLTVNVFWV